MLKLYEGTTSVCAIKVRLTLFEKEAPLENCPIDLRAGYQFDPGYLTLNPKGVVPTLEDDSHIVVESPIIQHYVDDIHPAPSLLPAMAIDRARLWLLMKQLDDELHPSTGNLTHAAVYRPAFLALDEETQSGSPGPMDRKRAARIGLVRRDPGSLQLQTCSHRLPDRDGQDGFRRPRPRNTRSGWGNTARALG